MALTAHIVQCEQQQKSKATAWFRFTLQKLQEIFLTVRFCLLFSDKLTLKCAFLGQITVSQSFCTIFAVT